MYFNMKYYWDMTLIISQLCSPFQWKSPEKFFIDIILAYKSSQGSEVVQDDLHSHYHQLDGLIFHHSKHSYWVLSRVSLFLLTSLDLSWDKACVSHISFQLIITWTLKTSSLDRAHIRMCLALALSWYNAFSSSFQESWSMISH